MRKITSRLINEDNNWVLHLGFWTVSKTKTIDEKRSPWAVGNCAVPFSNLKTKEWIDSLTASLIVNDLFRPQFWSFSENPPRWQYVCDIFGTFLCENRRTIDYEKSSPLINDNKDIKKNASVYTVFDKTLSICSTRASNVGGLSSHLKEINSSIFYILPTDFKVSFNKV